MANVRISIERVLEKLDGYLNKNDYDSAERHLLYWLSEAEGQADVRAELLVRNELMGLYRKLGKKQQALDSVHAAIAKMEAEGLQNQVGAATTYLNSGTVYKAFGMAEQSLPWFEKAKEIYARELPPDDRRIAGLYNNMALTLVDLKQFAEAKNLYRNAIAILEKNADGALDIAVTYLNLASAAEAELGLVDADEIIAEYLEKAKELLESFPRRDGYYAFVCEKCSSVFGYYGHFVYAKKLKERSGRIYEGT